MVFTQKLKRQGIWGRGCLVGARTAGLLLVLIFFSALVQGDEKGPVPAATLWYEELAAQGDVDAKYNLGMMNETGWSVAVDLKKAARWYRDAAKQGHAEAQLRLGMLYYLGLGGRQSKLKGESWIRKAAKQEHGFAQVLNEKLFGENILDNLDQQDVLRNVRNVYLQDGAKAAARLNQLIDTVKHETVLQQQVKEKTTIRERRETRVVAGREKEIARSGMSKANSLVENKKSKRIESVVPEFIGKETLEENRTLARGNIATIRLQAEKGQASAQYSLGRMYELGIKVTVNKAKALSWYEKAAIQGYADAEYRLAISLLYGSGAKRDETLGRKWLAAAASHDHQVARNLMANLKNKEGVMARAHSIAVNWYLERAVEGNAEAALRLGKIFEHGWGAMPDLREAIKWYQRASMLGVKDVDVLLQDLNIRLAQAEEAVGGAESESVTGNIQPSNWIAYLIAFAVAVTIIFWPVIKRGRRVSYKKLDYKKLGRDIPKEDPPFG